MYRESFALCKKVVYDILAAPRTAFFSPFSVTLIEKAGSGGCKRRWIYSSRRFLFSYTFEIFSTLHLLQVFFLQPGMLPPFGPLFFSAFFFHPDFLEPL